MQYSLPLAPIEHDLFSAVTGIIPWCYREFGVRGGVWTHNIYTASPAHQKIYFEKIEDLVYFQLTWI